MFLLFSGPASAAFSGGNFGKGNRVVPEAISITFDDVKGVSLGIFADNRRKISFLQ